MCGGLYKKSVLIQRLKAKGKTRKMKHICHRHREHEERKAVRVLPSFFYRPYGQGECWRELRKIIFSTHIIKNLVARLGGSREMFEMAASRQWNWSSQADLGKRPDIPVTLWNR